MTVSQWNTLFSEKFTVELSYYSMNTLKGNPLHYLVNSVKHCSVSFRVKPSHCSVNTSQRNPHTSQWTFYSATLHTVLWTFYSATLHTVPWTFYSGTLHTIQWTFYSTTAHYSVNILQYNCTLFSELFAVQTSHYPVNTMKLSNHSVNTVTVKT